MQGAERKVRKGREARTFYSAGIKGERRNSYLWAPISEGGQEVPPVDFRVGQPGRKVSVWEGEREGRGAFDYTAEHDKRRKGKGRNAVERSLLKEGGGLEKKKEKGERRATVFRWG